MTIRDEALPGLARVRGLALGADTPRLARVSPVAPDDGTFRLERERADGRRLTEHDAREEAGQQPLF